jgi:hypothetical protein
MEEQNIGFFEEEEGVRSMTRLKTFILLIFLCIFDSLYVYGGNKIDWFLIGFTFVLLIAIFYPQYLKQLAELGANWKGVNIGEKKNESS